jgi:hypothetical protein
MRCSRSGKRRNKPTDEASVDGSLILRVKCGGRTVAARALSPAVLGVPEKTARLLAALKAAVPFKVELVPSLVRSTHAMGQRHP